MDKGFLQRLKAENEIDRLLKPETSTPRDWDANDYNSPPAQSSKRMKLIEPAELSRLRAIEAAVMKALDDLRAAPELNPRNFDEDDAMRLNDAVCQVFRDLESAILGKDDL